MSSSILGCQGVTFEVQRMNCLFIISVSALCISSAMSDPLSNDIKQYFNSDSVKTIKRIWDDHRESIEHDLEYALQENIKDELKAFNMKPSDLRLTKAYYHKQGPVEVIFKNLDLEALPSSWMPRVSLSLDSNVLKINTALTKMVINAEYLLMRNKSDIIDDIVNRDPYKYSPFLFKEVRNTGKVTIWVDGCILSGYIIAGLKGGTIGLGHEKFTLTKCVYTIKIYKKDSPAFMVRYSVMKPAYSLGIKHYLLKAIRNKFITKLKTKILKTVNTSAIFGQNLPVYENEQKILFLKTSGNLSSLVKEQNRKIINWNGGTVAIPDYFCTWDYMDTSKSRDADISGPTPLQLQYTLPVLHHSLEVAFYIPTNLASVAGISENTMSAKLKLSKMMLSGLGTAIYSYAGGPYKDNTMMIGVQKRFSNLQVRGEIPPQSQNGNTHKFSVKISDFAINIDIDIEAEGRNQAKIEVVGYRDIKFDQIDVNYLPLQTLITGYLMDEVPRAIIKTIVAVANISAPPAVATFKSKSRQTENSFPGLSHKDTKSNISFRDRLEIKTQQEIL